MKKNSGDEVASDGHSDHIFVGVRVRPLGSDRGETFGIVVDSYGGIEVPPMGGAGRQDNHGKPQRFQFSGVYEPKVDNAHMFELIGSPLVDNVCSGYNSTLFAYGQTGSGKTYTIGEANKINTIHEGVAHRTIRDLFARTPSDEGGWKSRTITVQCPIRLAIERVAFVEWSELAPLSSCLRNTKRLRSSRRQVRAGLCGADLRPLCRDVQFRREGSYPARAQGQL